MAALGVLTASLAWVGLTHDNAPAHAGVRANASFAQLSSGSSQLPKDNSPMIVQMETKDAVSGIKFGEQNDGKLGDIVIQTAGTYFVMAAAQVGQEKTSAAGHVDLWLRQNGKDVANSNTRQSIADGKFTAVLVSQGIVECKAGDVINVMASTNAGGKGLGLVAIHPDNEPVIPSIIFSMYALN